jgi:hypothetical protein
MTQPIVSPASDAVADVRAQVHAHDRVVGYRRSGAGTALLLLAADDELWPGFAERLAEHYRLVVPELPANVNEVAGVVRCLLDGLGASGVPVIAAGRFCDAALELALGRNEFVGRVVLVPELMGETSDLPSGTYSRPPMIALPLCILSRDLPVADALRRTITFLQAPAAATSG